MVIPQPLFAWLWLFSLALLLAFALPSSSPAAEIATAVTVRESGAPLYSRHELDSDKIAVLRKGEPLTVLAEVVGRQSWYMVKTQRGLVGWMRAIDVSGGEQIRQAFKEQPKLSTWSVQTAAGHTFQGSWTVKPGAAADHASGTWTLGEGNDKIVLRGTWSARKFSTGWNGTWRATVEGQKQEFAGGWTADFPQADDAFIDDLFSSVGDAIRGIWSADNDSGSWSLSPAK
jgi:hypothetical protein